MPKIVTIGGGTGTFTLLSGLKKYIVDITAIVTMADSGGSTGRLRDEFGYLPVGDVRMALAALSDTNGRNIIRELFLYRFSKGEGLAGHNFGNLFLVALTDILGSEEAAFEYASKVLRISGKVLPVTASRTDIVGVYTDGTTVTGESDIDEPTFADGTEKHIDHIYLDPQVSATKKAVETIQDADLIVLGPGDMYTSMVPNLLVKGIKEALCTTKGKILYNINLMTKYGQTTDFTAQDHVAEITKYIGRQPDYVVMNTSTFSPEVLAHYEKEHEYPVVDNLEEGKGYIIIRENVVAGEVTQKRAGDNLKRSLIRHDSDKIAAVIMRMTDR